MEDAAGDVVVDEGEYEVFSFVLRFFVFFNIHSPARWWYSRSRWSPQRSGRPRPG